MNASFLATPIIKHDISTLNMIIYERIFLELIRWLDVPIIKTEIRRETPDRVAHFPLNSVVITRYNTEIAAVMKKSFPRNSVNDPYIIVTI